MAGVEADGARLDLFGGFRLTANGMPVGVSSRRARGLIAYLCAMRDGSAARERLAGLLWSDRGEEQARASLRQCLLEIKAALNGTGCELIDAGRETIRLKAGALSSDLAGLEAVLGAKDPAALTAALEATGSAQLLADGGLAGLFGDWLAEFRGQLDRRIAAAAHACLDELEAAQSWSAVRRLAEAYLQRDGLDERVVAAAMRADAALGHSSSAYRRFQILQAALQREYGLAPGAELREALASISAPQPGVAEPAPAQRPAALSRPPLVIVAAFEETGLEPQAGLTRAIRDEVVSGLARFRDLRVITDPQPFEGVGVEGVADTAGVYVLGATFRAAADEVKVTVRLLRMGDRQVIWSDVLVLPEPGVGQTTERIIAQVVGAVLPTINADLVQQAHVPPNAIYERYLLARDAASSTDAYEQARAAAKELEAVIAAEPAFVLPYLPLARLYNTDFGYTRARSSGEPERERAFQLTKSALARDRGHVHGYTVMGWCYLRRRQWDAARFHFDQAIELNSFHADRMMEAGSGYLFLGEIDLARRLLDRCLMLNPVPKDDFFTPLGFLELIRGDYARAASYFELIARPTLWVAIYSAAAASLGGAHSEAKAGVARKRLAAIWPPGVPMSEHAVVGWLDAHNPLRREEDRRRFLDAARQVLVQGRPAASDQLPRPPTTLGPGAPKAVS
jgi:DNA-binding SARP family transcriptional activator/Tfp pilus assembly protein PilF